MILKRFRKGREEIDRRLQEIIEKKDKLRGICIPYKIQGDETPYFQREEVVDAKIRLWELVREERNLAKGIRLLYRIFRY